MLWHFSARPAQPKRRRCANCNRNAYFFFNLFNERWLRISVCICTPSSKVILGVCYRPPDCASSFHTEVCSVLLDIKNRFPKANLLLFGDDFYFPSIDWLNLSPGGSVASKLFFNMWLNLNLTQVVGKPTHWDNVLDLILTTLSDLVKSIPYSDGLSYQNVLHIGLSLPVLIKHSIYKISRL